MALIENEPVPVNEQSICGVIMPISATANQSEAHWADVQTLLHRAVKDAGFIPLNVWENTAADRVSERIIVNIFEQPLVIADISDLNPNVMLELGLRLASKKPTIVIVNSGGDIPFDIRDFHVIGYPSDLNMLAMESFFDKLKTALQEKHSSFLRDDYQPFLGKIVVDVISPEHREVSVSDALIERLDDISQRISKMETRKPIIRSSRSADDEDRSSTITSGNTCYFTIKGDYRKAIQVFSKEADITDVKHLGTYGDESFISLKIIDGPSEQDLDIRRLQLRILGNKLGCSAGIGSAVLRNNGW